MRSYLIFELPRIALSLWVSLTAIQAQAIPTRILQDAGATEGRRIPSSVPIVDHSSTALAGTPVSPAISRIYPRPPDPPTAVRPVALKINGLQPSNYQPKPIKPSQSAHSARPGIQAVDATDNKLPTKPTIISQLSRDGHHSNQSNNNLDERLPKPRIQQAAVPSGNYPKTESPHDQPEVADNKQQHFKGNTSDSHNNRSPTTASTSQGQAQRAKQQQTSLQVGHPPVSQKEHNPPTPEVQRGAIQQIRNNAGNKQTLQQRVNKQPQAVNNGGQPKVAKSVISKPTKGPELPEKSNSVSPPKGHSKNLQANDRPTKQNNSPKPEISPKEAADNQGSATNKQEKTQTEHQDTSSTRHHESREQTASEQSSSGREQSQQSAQQHGEQAGGSCCAGSGSKSLRETAWEMKTNRANDMKASEVARILGYPSDPDTEWIHEPSPRYENDPNLQKQIADLKEEVRAERLEQSRRREGAAEQSSSSQQSQTDSQQHQAAED